MLVRERAELESARQSLEEAQRQEDVADREVNRAMEERDRAENEICARRDAVARASVDASRKKRELEDGERQVRDVQARFDSLKAILEERKRDSERKREEIATLQREGRSAVLGAVNSQQFGDTKGVDGIAKKFSEAVSTGSYVQVVFGKVEEESANWQMDSHSYDGADQLDRRVRLPQEILCHRVSQLATSAKYPNKTGLQTRI